MTPPIEGIRLRSVLLWGLANLALLGLGVSGFSLWAHHPAPKESICFFVLICGQVLVASLIFPKLAATIWTLVVNLLMLIPFAELAGSMSNLNQAQILRGIGSVGLWFFGLACWKGLLSDRKLLIVIALAGLFTVGGAILDYLRWEAVANSGASATFHAISLMPRLVQNTQFGEAGCWVEACLPLILAAFWAGLLRVTPQFTTKIPTP
jgi:hypothetical protein